MWINMSTYHLPSSVTASSCETYEYPTRGGESAGRSAESVSEGVSPFLVSRVGPGLLLPSYVRKSPYPMELKKLP
jgi:hypothetical protein